LIIGLPLAAAISLFTFLRNPKSGATT